MEVFGGGGRWGVVEVGVLVGGMGIGGDAVRWGGGWYLWFGASSFWGCLRWGLVYAQGAGGKT